MTKKENAEWLKIQQNKMIKALNEVMSIVASENLKPNYRPQYDRRFM